MLLEPIINKYPFARDMREEDLPAVRVIEIASNDFPWSEGILRDCMLVGYSCLVLEIESGICGFAVMSISGADAHLLNLCIHPAEQRRGYGRFLLSHCISVAKQLNAKTLFLEVRQSNYGAITLYEQFGFNQVSITKDYYPAPNDQREDAIIFALHLFSSVGWR